MTSRGNRRLRVGEVEITTLEQPAALAMLLDAVVAKTPRVFSFANAHSVNLARRSPVFAEALRHVTVFNDGAGIELASRILAGTPPPANLNGSDLTPALLSLLPPETKVNLLGSPPGVAEEARAALARRFPHIDFVGAMHGFFREEMGGELAAQVAESGAQLVIVGMGQPRQELWATRHVGAAGAVLLCAGAILDYSAGRFRRAPKWMQRARLEWAYRLAQEPVRLSERYLVGNFMFVWHVLRQKYAPTSNPQVEKA